LTNIGWRCITGCLWTCFQRVTVWIVWLLDFRGIAREYCNDLSYDGCHTRKWLTIQESPFVSLRTKKLVVSELFRIFFMEHEIDYRVTVPQCCRVTELPCHSVTVLQSYRPTVLPCHSVTVPPCYGVTELSCYHKPTNCFNRNLNGSIFCTIIRFTVIFFFHVHLIHPIDISPSVFSAEFWTHSLPLSHLSHARTITTSVIVALMIFYGQTDFFSGAVFRKGLKFPNNRATTFEIARF
jgi:hypothetical protein